MIDPSLTHIIRQYCDDELAPAEARAFEEKLASDPALKRAVENEKRLCECVCRCLNAKRTSSTPADLESRVRAALREAGAAAATHTTTESTHRTTIAQPTWRINYLAVAAAVTLVVGAVLFGILFPNIDSIRPANDTVAQAGVLSNIGAFVSDEHDRSSGTKNSLEIASPDDMSHQLSQALHSRVTCIDLSEFGYQFCGGAKCGAMPCGGSSGRMLFKRVNENGEIQGGPNISLFFVPRETLSDYLTRDQQRKWVKVSNLEGKCSHQVLLLDYPDSGLVYFLVTCDPKMLEPASESVLSQLEKACR